MLRVFHIALFFVLVLPVGVAVAADLPPPLEYVQEDVSEIRFSKTENENWEDVYLHLEALEPKYLSADRVFDLPDYPANDSAETAAELAVMLEYQNSLRTPENVEAIQRDQHGPAWEIFGLGADIPSHVKDFVRGVKEEALHDMEGFLYGYKRSFNRARPTQIVNGISLVIDVPGSPAYPSGHSTTTKLASLVYSYIDPANAEGYAEFATKLSQRRVIAGIHYPSDCTAGESLGQQIFDALLAVPEYKARLDRAKAVFELSKLSPEQVDAITFTEDRWDPSKLAMIEFPLSYLDAGVQFSVPAPPANSSDITQQELNMLRQHAANQRTPEQLALIELEHGETPKDMPEEEQKALYKKMQAHNSLALSEQATTDQALRADVDALASRLMVESGRFVMREKKRFARARPTQLALDLEPAVSVPGHAAYPSGHAMQFMLLARFLGYVDPARAQDYLKAAKDIAFRREIAGLHYASDTKAGHDMADEMFEKLLGNEKFKNEAESLKKRLDEGN